MPTRAVNALVNALIVATSALAVIAIAAISGLIPRVVLWVCLAASLLSLVCYAWDKFSATKGWRRTPENTLHLLALCGGWPGALLAQQWFRHKTGKPSFRRWFWITVVFNAGALAWLASPYGAGLAAWLTKVTSVFFK